VQNPYALQQIDGLQEVAFSVTSYDPTQQPPSPQETPPPVVFLAAGHPIDPTRIRQVTLGAFDEWILETRSDSLYYAHPVHIHINPFQMARYGPDGKAELVWKDTILVPQGERQHIFTRYTDYIGSYVYHCHILDHEDQGMMEVVEVVNP
jgi:FtsP/CotA-like multicopper oxidase with cupredoxin domain